MIKTICGLDLIPMVCLTCNLRRERERERERKGKLGLKACEV
jgi:hypothetical protein